MTHPANIYNLKEKFRAPRKTLQLFSPQKRRKALIILVKRTCSNKYHQVFVFTYFKVTNVSIMFCFAVSNNCYINYIIRSFPRIFPKKNSNMSFVFPSFAETKKWHVLITHSVQNKKNHSKQVHSKHGSLKKSEVGSALEY